MDSQKYSTLHFEGPYKQVCVDRPEDYSFYNKYDIDWSKIQAYQVQQKLGRGKYSEVYKGVNAANN